MLQALSENLDVILWRKSVRISSKLVPKLTYENQLLFWREAFQFRDFLRNRRGIIEKSLAQDRSTGVRSRVLD